MPEKALVRGPMFDKDDLLTIFRKWQGGAIGEELATQLVRERANARTIDASMLVELSDLCVRLCYQGRITDADAQVIHRLLIEVLRTDLGQLQAALPSIAPNYLRIATVCLWKRAEAKVYQRALALGEEGFAAACLFDRAIIAHRLGILHLDPYFASRKSSDLERWWRDADNESGAMPEPEQAFMRARAWLESALAMLAEVSDRDPNTLAVARLESLKALVQILCSAPFLGLPRDDAYIKRLLVEAAPLLPTVSATNIPSIHLYLKEVADALGVELSTAGSAESFMEVDWPARAAEFGIEPVASDMLAYLQSTCTKERFAEGLLLARRLRALFSAASEGLRTAYLGTMGTLLLHSDSFENIRQLIDAEREDDAIRHLHDLRVQSAELADWAEALDFLGAQLLVDSAVSAIHVERFDRALVAYCAAARIFLSLHCYQLALEMMGNAAQVMTLADEMSAALMCELMREASTPWFPEVIDKWQSTCQQLAQAATVPLTSKPNAEGWFAMLRLAKGPAYGDQCLSTARYDWRDDPYAVQLLTQIEQLERDSNAASKHLETTMLFEHALASYKATPKDAGGQTLGEQRDMLAARLDVHVRGSLAALTGKGLERFAISHVQQTLDERTVVLDLYYPMHAKEYGYCLAITHNSDNLFSISLPDQAFLSASMAGNTSEYWTSHAGVAIAQLRQLMQEEPEPGQVLSTQARRHLPHLSRLLLGGVFEWLEEQQRAGLEHLVVVPDGPAHFVNYAVLDIGHGPLADRWTVTSLPAMDLLRRAPQPGPLRTEAVVLGLGYARSAEALGVAPLVSAPAEADAVAKAMNTTRISEDEATPRRVLRALAEARYVHLACHGEHDVVSATLQSLVLTPDGNNGRLRHLDLFSLRLDGLEVVSLSACETGLGRLDPGGNPFGIASSLLASGVAAVVTTLWPVADDAAACFFSALYAQLAAGEPRRAAWCGALAATRKSFPEYRDWGAFHPSGRW